MRRIWRILFWVLATAGRPIGGIPPRRIALWLARRAYGVENPSEHEHSWIRDRDGLEFFVHPHYVMDADVIAFGSYEASLRRFIRSHLRPGMCCVDVGANVGFVSLYMAQRVGPTGRVYAFEPVPRLFEKLGRNIRRNRLQGRVEPRLCAVSRGPGRARMNVHDRYARNQGLALLVGPATGEPTEGMEVDCISLDDFAAREPLERIDFIKIDVQGAEGLVIEGAQSCLERFGPDVIMELSRDLSPLGRTPQGTIELMEEAGYRVFELTGGAIGRRLDPKALSADFSAANVFCSKQR